MYSNQSTGNSIVPGTNLGAAQPPQQYNGLQQDSHQQQQQQQNNQKIMRKKPYVRITEQPASKALRFRYECEGRSAGSIPGVNSTPENKTYPSIEICNYKGRAVVVVSCVTKDAPYRPHPHNLVGKEGCKKGVCTLEINSETMRAVFSNLGIQCVKKKDIESALKAREEIRVDPFKTGFSHRFQPSSIDLNSVRLCFQVFMESEQKGRFTQPLPPVVSEPIFDKKAMSDLVICRLCNCSASVLGNTQIILLCEKVAKEDIAIRFFEEKNGQVIWEAYGEFQHNDVHKQTAITFKTPRYHSMDITEPAKVFIQLKRPSDGITSEALPFEYVPLDSGRHTFWQLRQNLKRKPELDIFQQILAVDRECRVALEAQEIVAAHVSTVKDGTSSSSATLVPNEVIDLNTPTAAEEPSFDSVVAVQAEEEAAKRRSEHEVDTIIDEKVRELEQQAQTQLQEQISFETTDLEQSPLRQLSPQDKINEWMRSNELKQLERAASAEESVVSSSLSPTGLEDDRTLNELLEQVAELDDIYTEHMLRRTTDKQGTESVSNSTSTRVGNANGVAPLAMEVDDIFDDNATYTSLQIAFKNPINIPTADVMPPTPPASHIAPEDTQQYEAVNVLRNTNAVNRSPSAPVNAIYSVPHKALPPKATSPHMHVTAAEEEKIPPLPPKRVRKQDQNIENRAIEANISPSTTTTVEITEQKLRTDTPIIIMRSPDQSPPTKRLPAKPYSGSCGSLPAQKKSGFFSKLFSRRKSKPEYSQTDDFHKSGSKATSPNISRDSSLGNFHANDPKRASVRSVKSLNPSSLPSSPSKKSPSKSGKTSKPVGRSVSSVSGKRPAHLNADVIHIPLKGESSHTLPRNEAYSSASTLTLGQLDRRTVSALQLAEIPISDGNMELVAIADRQSLKNLCESQFNVQLDPNVDLTEAEHFALYTSIPPYATTSEFDEASAYYAAVDAGEILTPDEIAQRLAAAAADRSN